MTKPQICSNCPLYNEPLVPYEGEGKIYIVGMCPSHEEVKQGRPFVGRSGQLLRKILKLFDLENDVRIANVCKCFVEAGEKLPEQAKNICKNFLFDDIRKHKPSVVVALGEEAVSVFYPQITRITDFVGQVWYNREFDCFFLPNFHPSFLLRRGDMGLVARFKRVFRQIKLGLEKPITRTPQIFLLKEKSDIKDWLNKLIKETDVCAFDFETTTSKPYNGEIYTIAFAFKDVCFSFPYNLVDAEIRNLLISIWQNKNILKIAHNLLFESEWIYAKFKTIIENATDTMILHFALHGGELETHGLKLIAQTKLGVKDWTIDMKKLLTTELDTVLHYNALDSFYTLLLYENLQRDFAKLKQDMKFKPSFMRLKYKKLCEKILIPLLPYIGKAIVDGIPVSKENLSNLESNLKEEVFKLVKKIYTDKQLLEYHKETKAVVEALSSYDSSWYKSLARVLEFVKNGKLSREEKKLKERIFNVNSNKQLAEFLLHLGCKLPKTEKGNYSVKAEVLESFQNVPVVKNYLKLKKVLKKLSTYVEGSRRVLYPDSRFHPNFVVIGNNTSRFMSNSINVQNFPKNAGKEVRNIISAPDGYVIISADFKNLEVRGEALLSGDDELTKMVVSGSDVHLYWSEKLFGKSKAKEYKHKAKNGFVFPMLYGAGVKTLCQGVGWELNERNLNKMKKIRDEFWRVHPKIKQRHRDALSDYERFGEVYDMCGRFRKAPIEKGEKDDKRVDYNAIINYAIQSSCFYFTMNAWLYLLKKGYWSPFELHDEIVVFVRESEKEIAQAVRDIHYAMTTLNHETFSIFKKSPVRLEVDMKIGKHFGSLVEFDWKKYLKEV